MATLTIKVQNDAMGGELAGLPLWEGQYVMGEIALDDNHAIVIVTLGEREDVTPGQARALNTNPHVLEWDVS